MPIYEYRCECGQRRQMFSHAFTPKLPSCESCGRDMARRVSVPAGLPRAAAPAALSPVPRSWDGLKGGSREAITYWRGELDRRQRVYGQDAPMTRGTPSVTCNPPPSESAH